MEEEELPVEEEFTFDAKPQKEWGIRGLLAFFLGGMGAGLFLVASLLGLTGGMIAGWLIVAIGKNGIHLIELGHPNRFLLALSKPGSSWISRGLIITVLFLILGALQIAPSLTPFSWFPWSAESIIGREIQVLAILTSFAVMIYVGFVLSSAPSIPFWNTSLVPLLFVLFSLASGTALILASLPFIGSEAVDIKLLQSIEGALILASLVFMLVFLVSTSYSSVAARESLRLIITGPLSLPFLIGVIAVGLVLPLLASLYLYLAQVEDIAASVFLGIVGILVLIGGFLFNYTFVKAGIYTPQL